MRHVPLTRGPFALVDDVDWESVSRFKWNALARSSKGKFYARAWIGGRHTLMHCFLTGGNRVTDHIDLDGLNNQRSNLRRATHSQNLANAPKRAGCLSRWKGVTPRRARWIAQIRVNSRQLHIGVFAAELVAAVAYDLAARRHFGAFARLNFPYGAG